MATYEVWNFGPERRIPWKDQSYILLVQNAGIKTENEELAEHIGKFPKISVKQISQKINQEAGIEQSDSQTKQLESMRMAELNKLAAERGIKGFFGKTKAKIIALLTENSGGIHNGQ